MVEGTTFSDDTLRTIETTEGSDLLTGLTVGTSHSLRIRTVLENGTTSSWSTTITHTPTAADAPADLSAADHANGGVLVTYTPLSVDDNVHSYELQAVEGTSFTGDTLRTVQTHSGSHRFWDPDVVVLTPGVEHSMRIRTKLIEGAESAWSTTITHTPASANSDPPTDLVAVVGAVTGSTTALSLEWQHPTSLYASEIKGYEIAYRLSTATNWTAVSDVVHPARTVSLGPLTRGTSAYQVRVRTEATDGSVSPWVTQTVTLPSSTATTPSGLSLIYYPGTQASLAWDRVVGASGYHVQGAREGTVWPAAYKSLTSTSVAFPNLVGGSTYGFRVRQTHAGGWVGPWSSTHFETVDYNAAIVDSVTAIDFQATAVSGGAVDATLSWVPRRLGRASIVEYQTGYKLATADDFTAGPSTTAPTTTASLAGLTAGGAYVVRVRLRSGNAWSPWVEESVTLPSAMPSAPTGLTSKLLASGSPDPEEPSDIDRRVYLDWNPVASATAYQVQYTDDTSAWPPDYFTTSGLGTTHTEANVHGLDEGETWTFRVRATYAGGYTGPWSSETSRTIAAGAPGIPRELSIGVLDTSDVVAGGPATVELGWHSPAFDGGAGVTGYALSVTPAAESGGTIGSAECVDAYPEHPSYPGRQYCTATFSGIKKDSTEYTYSVAAKNANGTGAYATYEYAIGDIVDDEHNTPVSSFTIAQVPGTEHARLVIKPIALVANHAGEYQVAWAENSDPDDLDWSAPRTLPGTYTGTSDVVHTVSGLALPATGSRTYALRVRARQVTANHECGTDGCNAHAWTAWRGGVTLTMARPRPAPIAMGASAIGQGVSLGWTQPDPVQGTAWQVAYTTDENDWSAGGTVDASTASAVVTDLAPGVEHAFRARAAQSVAASTTVYSAWSDVVRATPLDSGVALIGALPDVALDNDATQSLDMTEHFSGTDLTYAVLVTTTHKDTGNVKTAPINTVARNKVRGAWSDDVLTLTAGPSGDHVLTLAVTATNGDGASASDSFQLTVGSGFVEPAGLAGAPGDGTVALTWTAPAGAAVLSYEADIGVGGDWSAGPEPVTGIAETSTTITGLTNGIPYDFRVRAVNSAGAGGWSPTITVTPAAPATLVLDLPDLELANDAVHDIDLAQHFTGTELTYAVVVTTTNKRTGKVKTGPINTMARNKVRGSWSGNVLTLTAGSSGHHVLGMAVVATDMLGGTANDDFQLTVGTPAAESLATEALQSALASQARSMLEDASSAIGGRMQSGGPGTDALSAFAGLFGGSSGPGACPLDTPLHECVSDEAEHHEVSGFKFGSAEEDAAGYAIDLTQLRERVKSQGFAVSLNQSLSGASDGVGSAVGDHPEEALALTFWGRGGAASGTRDPVFWGLDASMGDRWLTGVAFAESGGEVAQSLIQGEASVSGLAESDISAVYPYLRSRLGSGTEVWGLFGFGSGWVDSTWTEASSLLSEDPVHLDGDVAFDLGLFGAERSLLEREGFTLSALGDVGWSRLSVTSGLAEGVEATVTRTRLGLEGRYASRDGALSSGLRAGARVDGGDGQTASGLELLGDVRRTWGRWLAGVEGRWYAADTAEAGLGARGLRATFGLQPRANGTGLGLELSPGWGAGGEAVKQDGLLASLRDPRTEPRLHLDARVSWGMRLLGRGLYGPGERLSPYAELSLAGEGSRLLRAGLALEGPVSLGLGLERREGSAAPAEHGVMLRLDTRF